MFAVLALGAPGVMRVRMRCSVPGVPHRVRCSESPVCGVLCPSPVCCARCPPCAVPRVPRVLCSVSPVCCARCPPAEPRAAGRERREGRCVCGRTVEGDSEQPPPAPLGCAAPAPGKALERAGPTRRSAGTEAGTEQEPPAQNRSLWHRGIHREGKGKLGGLCARGKLCSSEDEWLSLPGFKGRAGRGAWGRGSLVALAVLGERLASGSSEGFSSLNNSVIPWGRKVFSRMGQLRAVPVLCPRVQSAKAPVTPELPELCIPSCH